MSQVFDKSGLYGKIARANALLKENYNSCLKMS